MAVQILRLKRTDNSGQHLLVHISQTGSKALDLKLVGTEHEHLYHANIKESDIKSLQANNYTGGLQDWKTTLTSTLLHQETSDTQGYSAQGLETVAAISGKILTVTIRKNVEGITQRLGSIRLVQDDEREEVSAFDWVDTAVANREALRTELEALQASVTGQQDEVTRLTKQLDDLVTAKKEHEEELLKKFAALLNTKKLKIRDQQRLLAGAKVDPKVAKAVETARGSSGGKEGATSVKGKRKASESEEVDEEMQQGEDADGGDASEYDEERQETPPRTDAEETDDEDDLDVPPKLKIDTRKGGANGTRGKENGAEMDVDEELEPPPRRELPDAIRASSTRSKPEAQLVADEDDDETDDEL